MFPCEPMLPLDLPETIAVRIVPHEELEATLETAIRAGADGRLSRGAELFLASVCAAVLADRLRLAGLLVVRPGPTLHA